LYDVDGNRYIDYIASWGPMILGHAYPSVVKAIQSYASRSTSYGAPTLLEVEMAELILSMVPNMDLVRMVSSGTEACMSALRLARGFTGKNKFIKFEGNYHGHADSFLVKAGSGVATLEIKAVPGVTEGVAKDTLIAPYNDIHAVEKLFLKYENEIAAVIVEPVAGNMGCIIPKPGFLEGLRKLCSEKNAILIFDEVMTGFRLGTGGAQQVFNVEADLVTYGKVIGGGMPVGAFAGKRQIMEHIAPLGNVYQAGTLSGNPIAMIAGFTLLTELKSNPAIYKELEAKTTYLRNGLDRILGSRGGAYQINQFGSMISVHFSEHPVTDYASAAKSNNERFKKFFHAMLKRGIYLPPSAFESWFLNNALSTNDLEYTLEMVKESLTEIE
jgi:glutamate-1-semialdehyde 2,1-aminomutase